MLAQWRLPLRAVPVCRSDKDPHQVLCKTGDRHPSPEEGDRKVAVVEVTRIQKSGSSLGIHLHKKILAQFPVNLRDVVAVRVCGEKLVIQRIAVEELAKIRTGEPEVRPL